MKANTITQFTYRNARVDKMPKVLVLYVDEDKMHGINLNYIGADYTKILKHFEADEFDDPRMLYETRIKNSPLALAYRIYMLDAIVGARTLEDPAVKVKTSFFTKVGEFFKGDKK